LKGIRSLVVLALLLAGCSPPPAATPRLRVALPTKLSSLDPHLSDTSGAYTVLGNVYEALVSTDPGLRRRPNLALRWQNPDPLTWDFDLDPEARFHSGRPVVAEDVVFSIRRVLSEPGLDTRYYLGDVARAEARTSGSVRLMLTRPSPALLSRLGHVYIVPAGSTRESLERAPDGTGAYRVVRWQPGARLQLEAAPGRRGGQPAVPEVDLRVDVPPTRIVNGLLAGEFDMALLGLDRGARSLPEAEFAAHRRPSLQVRYLGLDVGRDVTAQVAGRNPFRDRRVRKAVQVAIDRPALVAGLPGDAQPANQLVPRHVFGFETALPEIAHDREQARRLLKAAGFGNGFRVALHTREVLAEAAAPLAGQLATVGIDARPVVLADAQYFELLRRREASLWLDRWACTTGDSGEMFENAFHSPDSARGLGAFNESGYADPGMDRAIEAALAIEDLPRRRIALAGLMRRIMDEAVWVPLFNDDERWVVRRSFVWRPRANYWLQLAEVAPAAGLR